jgi:formylglycine-generating enzyme required for sulfatase activity
MWNDSKGWIGVRLNGNRYHVVGFLGEGGMGYVYRARDETLGTDVVVKVPHAESIAVPGVRERFSREIRSLVQLAHPNIVRVTDVGEHSGLPFVVLQFLGGGSLEDRRPKGPSGQALPAPISDVHSWLAPIAGTLDFMHRKNYIHRDVKPANVLFDEHGHAFLSDFGITKILSDVDRDPKTAHLSRTGMIIGTPHYLSPEAAGDDEVDGRADQYSLAVAIFVILAARFPIEGRTVPAIIAAHLTKPPLVLFDLRPDLPQAVSDALAKALSKSKHERFPTCLAFANALMSGMSNEAIVSVRTTPLDSQFKPSSVSPQPGDVISNTIGMKLVYIPAGEFVMGNPDSRPIFSYRTERKTRLVRITRPFYLGQTAVTQGQWEAVMHTRAWSESASHYRWPTGPNFPAYDVNWDDASEFCRRLSKMEGRQYRLPTEAEWEYSCRAGGSSKYFFGDNVSLLGDFAWHKENALTAFPREVAQKRPNAWGLYDLLGNVDEWCSNWCSHEFYAPGTVETDPTGPVVGENRVLRGGNYLTDPTNSLFESGNGGGVFPAMKIPWIGFRVALAS